MIKLFIICCLFTSSGEVGSERITVEWVRRIRSRDMRG